MCLALQSEGKKQNHGFNYFIFNKLRIFTVLSLFLCLPSPPFGIFFTVNSLSGFKEDFDTIWDFKVWGFKYFAPCCDEQETFFRNILILAVLASPRTLKVKLIHLSIFVHAEKDKELVREQEITHWLASDLTRHDAEG